MSLPAPAQGPATTDQRSSSEMLYGLGLSLFFLVILCVSYSINAADRQIFPTLLPAIRKAFGFDLKIAGLLSTIFTLGLAVAGIPTGYILDRTSRKAVILIGMLIYSVFTLATVWATGFWDMLFYRAMTGIGEGMQMAGLFAAVGSYFHRKRSFYIGWMIVAYGVGGFFGPRIGAQLAQATAEKAPQLANVAWHTPFIWFAGIGLGLAALVLIAVPKGFSESKGPGSTAAVDVAALSHMPTNVWNRNVVMGFIGSVILGYSLYGFLGLYTTYVRDVLKFTPMTAAVAFSYFGLGGFMSFVGGWFGDRFPQRWVTAGAFGFLAAVGYSMYNLATTLPAQCALCFLTGALGSGFVFVNLLALLQRSVRPQMVGRASGIFLTSLFGAASTSGYLMAALVGKFGWGGAALVELTLLPIVGMVAMVFVNPNQLIVAKSKKA